MCGRIVAILLFKKLNINKLPFKLENMIKDLDTYIVKKYLMDIEGEVDVDTLKQDLLMLEEKTALTFGERITHIINNINKETFKKLIDKEDYQLFF